MQGYPVGRKHLDLQPLVVGVVISNLDSCSESPGSGWYVYRHTYRISPFSSSSSEGNPTFFRFDVGMFSVSVGTESSIVVVVILEYDMRETLVPVPDGNQKVVPGPKAHQLSNCSFLIYPFLPVSHQRAASLQCVRILSCLHALSPILLRSRTSAWFFPIFTV